MEEKIKTQEKVNEKTERLAKKLYDHCTEHNIALVLTVRVDGGTRAILNGTGQDIKSQIVSLIKNDKRLSAMFSLDAISYFINKM